MIVEPISLQPDAPLSKAEEIMSTYHISGVPITDPGGRLVGILTNRDLRFETRMDLKVSQVMKRDKLVTAPVGTSLEKARDILHEHRIEKLPVVNKNYELKGLITIKDIDKNLRFPRASKDARGRNFRTSAAAAAIPTRSTLRRTAATR